MKDSLKCLSNKYNLNSSPLSYTSVSYGMLSFLYSQNLKFIITVWFLLLLPLIQIFIISCMGYWKTSSNIHVYTLSQFQKIFFCYNICLTKAQPSSSQASVAPCCLQYSEPSYHFSECLFNFISLLLLPYIYVFIKINHSTLNTTSTLTSLYCFSKRMFLNITISLPLIFISLPFHVQLSTVQAILQYLQ